MTILSQLNKMKLFRVTAARTKTVNELLSQTYEWSRGHVNFCSILLTTGHAYYQ